MRTTFIILTAIFLFLNSEKVTAQPYNLPDSIVVKINKFFSKWDNTNSPGCTIGIVRNDSLLFAKGYGMANLEYGIPNIPQTIYYMGGVSQQFTAYAIVLLARQGKLSLDDSITKYLPWFPDMGEKITIRHLLNHTSGIRDELLLLEIAGTRVSAGDIVTRDHIIKLLSKQKELNFKPGEQHIYSNSNFALVSEIIQKVSGQSLSRFCDSAIFKPMGMNNTHFYDDYTELIKNRAYSYTQKDSVHYANNIENCSSAGETGLYTDIYDLGKWIVNYYDPKGTMEENFRVLTQQGKLNNGNEIRSALGVFVETYKGLKYFNYEGGLAGFHTNMSVFPDLKMGFMIFGNLNDVGVIKKTLQLADLFIKDTIKQTATTKDTSMAFVKDSLFLKNYVGDYVSDEGILFHLRHKNDKLYFHLYSRKENNLLIPDSLNTFTTLSLPDHKFIFSISGKDTTLVVTTTERVFHHKKYRHNPSPSYNTLRTYTGIYYCPELDCKYSIILKNHRLLLTNSKYSDVPLHLVGANDLYGDEENRYEMSHLQITRDGSNKIIGFETTIWRVQHLKFIKIE